MANISSTYVKSINGKTGGTYPRNLSTDVQIFATNIKRNGASGDAITVNLRNIAANMRPLAMENIEGSNEDYCMAILEGIPYNPSN